MSKNGKSDYTVRIDIGGHIVLYGAVDFFSASLGLWLTGGVFLAPIVQVSLMTMRTIFVTRGHTYSAMACAFFEMNIWLFAISHLLFGMNDPVSKIAYAACFSFGVLPGTMLDRMLSLGIVSVHAIVERGADDLMQRLGAAGFIPTQRPVYGLRRSSIEVFSIVERKREKAMLKIIHDHCPENKAWTIDVRSVASGLLLFWSDVVQGKLPKTVTPGPL